MKIKFKKKRIYINLILGIAWLGLGLYTIFFEENLKWINYFNVVLGIIYIGHYIFDFINQYLTIENGTISKNLLYGNGKKIKLNEIISIKKFAGDLTISTEQHKLIINHELIDPESFKELNEILRDLNLPADKTPFANIG